MVYDAGVTGDLLLRTGVVVNRVAGVQTVLESASKVEALGYGAAWLTNGGPEDCMPLLAAIADRTRRLKLGTSVVQTYPRHPVVLANEANVVDQLAPGRLRIGIGPSHAAVMEALGIERSAPLAHLGEYLAVLRGMAAGTPVDFQGQHYRVRSGLGRRMDVPIMVGALQASTFDLAGRAADGAITWLCPASYLTAIGIPAMEAGARAAHRDRPSLVAHLTVCVHDRAEDVREAVRAGIPNIRFPSYQRMLVAAGFEDAARGVWTDSLIDAVIAWGPADRVAERVREMFAAGADEVLLRPLGAGPDPEEVGQATITALARSL